MKRRNITPQRSQEVSYFSPIFSFYVGKRPNTSLNVVAE